MKKILSIIFTILIFFTLASTVQAGLSDAFGSVQETVGNRAGYKTASEADLTSTISSIIYTFLSILGVLFVGLLIYGGVTWMTAGGRDEKVNEAKGTIKQSIIGLIIVLGAYALSYFIISALSALAG